MSEDMKDPSDSVEKKEGSLRTLEKRIEALQTDNKVLKEKIEEQNSLINEKLKSFINDLQDIEEIKILKEMIVSQRQEIYQKEKEIKHLEANVIELTEEIKKYVVMEKELKDTTLLEEAHQVINNILAEKTDLENQLVNLSNKFVNLEKQNEILLKNLEKAKANQEIISKLETTINQLNRRISELEKENMTVSEKNGTSIGDREYISKLEDKIVEYDEIISNLEEAGKSNSETIEKLKTDYSIKISEINVNIENAQKTIAQLEEDNKNLREKVKLSEDMEISKTPKKISEISHKIVQEKDQDKSNIQPTERRRLCPQCGNRNLRLIREIEDKTKIISTYPRMYGKKNKCGQCGFEWH